MSILTAFVDVREFHPADSGEDADVEKGTVNVHRIWPGAGGDIDHELLCSLSEVHRVLHNQRSLTIRINCQELSFQKNAQSGPPNSKSGSGGKSSFALNRSRISNCALVSWLVIISSKNRA